MPNQLLDVILYYIDFHTPTTSRPTDFRKTIFIFIRYVKLTKISHENWLLSFSNTGAKPIVDLTEKNHRMSLKRENYNILEFQQILSDASTNEQGQCKWIE